MAKTSSVVFDRAFRRTVVERMEAGESVSALALELNVFRQVLQRWRTQLRRGGPRPRGRPRKRVFSAPTPAPEELALREARARIAELERKVGRQQLELDFFKRALREVEALRQPSEPGATASTPSSKR